ncbi:MAG: hypothetical protein F6K31_20355 [Symploca sp. SIO2G7]|nr:hypothetical protein [Symploca sp. SIO2G7]
MQQALTRALKVGGRWQGVGGRWQVAGGEEIFVGFPSPHLSVSASADSFPHPFFRSPVPCSLDNDNDNFALTCHQCLTPDT